MRNRRRRTTSASGGGAKPRSPDSSRNGWRNSSGSVARSSTGSGRATRLVRRSISQARRRRAVGRGLGRSGRCRRAKRSFDLSPMARAGRGQQQRAPTAAAAPASSAQQPAGRPLIGTCQAMLRWAGRGIDTDRLHADLAARHRSLQYDRKRRGCPVSWRTRRRRRRRSPIPPPRSAAASGRCSWITCTSWACRCCPGIGYRVVARYNENQTCLDTSGDDSKWVCTNDVPFFLDFQVSLRDHPDAST